MGGQKISAAKSKKKPSKRKSESSGGGLSDRDACLLWGRAGAHCSNPACQRLIGAFLESYLIGNAGERAHIVGRKPAAARGDPDRSTKLAASLGNHILLCLGCHKMVDDNPEQFPETMLLEWKRNHEARVASLLGIGLKAARTCAIHVRARFGTGAGRVLVAEPHEMLSATLQVGRTFDGLGGHISIDADTFRRDSDAEYWQFAPGEIEGQLEVWAQRRDGFARIPHLSIFPSGPIPLLIALGKLVGDTRPVDVRDFDRDAFSWRWPDLESPPIDFAVTSTALTRGDLSEIRLVIDLSGRTDRSAQSGALGGLVLPEVLVTTNEPRTGLIRGPKLLPPLRRAFQKAFELAKQALVDGGMVHVFAAMPASASVAFGQASLPKAMPTMRVYDFNDEAGGWRPALTLGRK